MDPNALKQALAQAIQALSAVADMVGGGEQAAPAAPQQAAPEAAKAPGQEEYNVPAAAPAAPPAPEVCQACGRPMEMGKNAEMGYPEQGIPPMAASARKAATGDMSYSDMEAADGQEDLAHGQEGAVIKGGKVRKASEPAGSDQFHPGKPEGKVPHDEGGSLGLGAPENGGNSREDLSGKGVEGAVIKTPVAKSAGEGDLVAQLGSMLSQQLAPLADSVNKAHERLSAIEGRSGRKALAKSAESASEGANLTFDQALAEVLMGRLSIGDGD